jgi:hypothetical protein
MEDLLERVIAVAQAFARDEIPHSFGGAIALAYYAPARPTRDVDINVYLRVHDAGRALDCLQKLGVAQADDAQRAEIEREGQTRLYWDGIPLDLFFWNLEFHASCFERHRRLEPRGSDRLQGRLCARQGRPRHLPDARLHGRAPGRAVRAPMGGGDRRRRRRSGPRADPRACAALAPARDLSPP